MDTITLGGGCFWCLDAVFRRVEGISSVVSGYAGGGQGNVDYRSMHSGKLNHAEVVQISYDSKKVSIDTILDMFFYTHDPTTKDRQGNDVGPEYRSIFLYEDENQKVSALDAIKRAQQIWSDPIVTEVVPLDKFTEAEKEHQDFYNNNSSNGYCQVIINPKLAKFEKNFEKYLKK